MMDFIVSHITEILTLLIAVAAILTAFLSYLFRPTKLEVERKHSDDLKDLIRRWEKDVTASHPKSVFEIKANEEFDLTIPVEQELYFEDIKNHIPSDMDLLKPWEIFKKNWHDYEKNRHIFFNDIKNDISKKIDLPYSTNWNWDKKPGFSIYFIVHIYADLSNISEGRKPYWATHGDEINEIDGRYEFKSDNYLLWSNSKEVTEKARDSYYDILKNLPQSSYIETTKNLTRKYEQLKEERDILIKNLNYLAFIPLLPGKCKYIKWSLPGFIGRVKKLFKIIK